MNPPIMNTPLTHCGFLLVPDVSGEAGRGGEDREGQDQAGAGGGLPGGAAS